MTRCRTITLLAASAAVALTACSSDTSGAGSGGSASAPPSGTASGSASGSTSTSASGSSVRSSSAAASTPEGLASTLREGLNSTRSAHITLRIATGGQTITGSGDETLSAGKVRGLTITEIIPGAGTLQLIRVDGKTYARLPAKLNTTAKPYVLVTPTSSNPTVRSLATSLQSSQSSTAVDTAGVFAAAARSIDNRGPATVDGTRTTHYAVVVDVAKLPIGYAGRSALVQGGIQTLPIDLYVDSAGRPVQVSEKLTVSGQSVSSSFGVTRYNQPVTIKAPPASQISSS